MSSNRPSKSTSSSAAAPSGDREQPAQQQQQPNLLQPLSVSARLTINPSASSTSASTRASNTSLSASSSSSSLGQATLYVVSGKQASDEQQATGDQQTATTSSMSTKSSSSSNLAAAEALLTGLKKRNITGVLHDISESELTCPICFDMIEAAYVTKCGHTFCQACISQALEHAHKCPKCNTPCTMNRDVFPNFAFNQIIERFKGETQTKKSRSTLKVPSNILQLLQTSQDELQIEEVDEILQLMIHRKETLKQTNEQINELVLCDFLKHLKQVKLEELNKLQHEIQMLNEDHKLVEQHISALKRKKSAQDKSMALSSDEDNEPDIVDDDEDEDDSGEPPAHLPVTSHQASEDGMSSPSSSSNNQQLVVAVLQKQQKQPSSSASAPQSATAAGTTSNKAKARSLLARKKRITHRYFEELSQVYMHYHIRDFSKEFGAAPAQQASSQALVTSGSSASLAAADHTTTSSSAVLDAMRETITKITNCNELRCIATVNYNSDFYNASSSIVSSVDFDKTYEHFAMAGVTKRIKIFDFASILERPYNNVHYALKEIQHTAKLSCVNWNRYFKHQLVCCDYEGAVTTWDAESCQMTRNYQEHEKRCWSVQFCEADPRLIASASDDTRVKIWSTNSEYSVMSLEAKSNACCVVFRPQSKYHVLFGTADHSIHYYDLRNPKEPVSLFRGHRKAVSYVKFCDENSFVSASTDSSLKLWTLNERQCVRTFTSHVNEKNFVGLETHGGYILTGSETNTVYLYCNELSKPLLSYKFEDSSGFVKKEESGNEFVSSVCWSNENYVLAANSQGLVKVLELV